MENVIQFRKRSGYDDLLFFFNGLETENTVKRYKLSIERFIRKQYDIPLEHVQPFHFQDLTYTDLKKYRDHLRKEYSPSTVNNEMAAIFSLLKELNRIQRDGQYVYEINVERLKTKPLRVTQVNSSGDISWEEVDSWMEYLKDNQVANWERKCAFLELARITGFRKEALASLTFRNLVQVDGVWQIKSTLKGKETKISLKDEHVEMVLALWEDKENKEESILKMSTKTMERLLNFIKEKFQIQPERKVTLHSLRGLSIYESYLASGNDLLVSQSHANHSNMETTYSYIKSRESVKNQVSLYMGKDLMKDKRIDELTVDQWKEVYKKLSRSGKYEILRILDGMK